MTKKGPKDVGHVILAFGEPSILYSFLFLKKRNWVIGPLVSLFYSFSCFLKKVLGSNYWFFIQIFRIFSFLLVMSHGMCHIVMWLYPDEPLSPSQFPQPQPLRQKYDNRATQWWGQWKQATKGRRREIKAGKVVTTKKGPNNARRVVWAFGESFILFSMFFRF